MINLEFSCHISNIGWTPERGNLDLVFFEGQQIEAIKFKVDNFLCKYANSDFDTVGWMEIEDNGIAGTVGEKKPLYAIAIESKKNVDVYYRVYLRGIGWTPFYCNGNVCGDYREGEAVPLEGIQIFVIDNKTTLDDMLKEADLMLFRYNKIKSQLFVDNYEKMLLACTKNYHYNDVVSLKEIQNGIILPLKKTDMSSRNGVFAGGVCDEYGCFVAGLDRKRGKKINWSCIESYPFDKENLLHSNDTVIFGGIIIRHFGHLFVECLSRLWYIIENSSCNDKIVILTIPGETDFTREFFLLLGIDLNRIIIINEPTQFHNVKIPDQTVNLWSGFYDKYHMIYDEMRKNVTPMPYKKIFLTRKAFGKNDSINEEFFDKFYEKQGYTLIAPETYSIPEQVAIIAGADEVVCTEGTLSHLILFAKPGTKIVIFRRDFESILLPQLIINQARKVDVTYVDATFNYLPTKHTNGCYLYGPTEHFKRYIQQQNFEYSEEDVLFDINQYLYEYTKKWCDNYNILKNFNDISEVDLFDIVERMNKIFKNKSISRNKYVTKVKANEKKLKEEICKLKKEKNNQKTLNS